VKVVVQVSLCLGIPLVLGISETYCKERQTKERLMKTYIILRLNLAANKRYG